MLTNIKIYMRHSTIWNTFLYIILLFLSVYLSQQLVKNESIFSNQNFLAFIWSHKAYSLLTLFTLVSIYLLKRSSLLFLIINICFQAYLIFGILVDDLNKLVLILNFILISCSYYFILNWKLILDLACYNPFYGKSDMELSALLKIPCEVENNGQKSFEGYLTNWDHLGCFIRGKGELIDRESKITINTIGHSFTFKARQTSRYQKDGVGFIFENEDNEDWSNFISIINDRGYTSDLVVQS